MVEKGLIKISGETYYKCPMCNNPYKGKDALKEHVTSGHTIAMDMFEVNLIMTHEVFKCL